MSACVSNSCEAAVVSSFTFKHASGGPRRFVHLLPTSRTRAALKLLCALITAAVIFLGRAVTIIERDA